MKSEHSLTTYVKTNSKWNKDLNVRLETIKIYFKKIYKKQLKKKKIRRTLFNINHSSIFFLTLSSGKRNKSKKINKWDLIKLKNFCKAKETIDIIKR